MNIVNKLITRYSFIRFCIIGAIGFVCDSSILWLCVSYLQLSPISARLISSMLSVSISWLLHRSYTFQQQRVKLMAEYKRYSCCWLASFTINLTAYTILVKKIPLFWQFPVLALICATAISMNFSYFVMRKLVFLQKPRKL